MQEVSAILRGLTDSPYPGYRGSGNRCQGENLATYGEKVTLFLPDKSHPEGVLRDRGLGFDIERSYTWDSEYKILGYDYTMMISAEFPKRRWNVLGKPDQPTLEEFLWAVALRRGFELERAGGGLVSFRNQTNANLLVNRRENIDHISIAVIQDEGTPDLAFVTQQVVPYAVDVFNAISNPIWRLDQNVVDQAVNIAVASDKIIPRCRI